MKYLSTCLLALMLVVFLASCARRRGMDTGLGRPQRGHDCHCGVFHP